MVLPTSYGDFSIVDMSRHENLISNEVLGKNGIGISTTKSANVIAGLQVNYYSYVSGYRTGVVKHTLVKKDFTDPEDFTDYRVLGLVEISGDVTQPGDSG